MNRGQIMLVCLVLTCTLLINDCVEAFRGGRGGGTGGRRPAGRRPGGRDHGHGHGHGHDDSGSKYCTCSESTLKPMEVFTGTTAGSEKQVICAAEKEFDCYKIGTAGSSSYTKECIEESTNKPGTCPTIAIPGRGRINAGCTDDTQCRGQSKCCTLTPYTDAECVEPVQTSKCGNCPANTDTCTLDAAFNEEACTSDVECPGFYLCCDCGATKKCTMPASSTTITP